MEIALFIVIYFTTYSLYLSHPTFADTKSLLKTELKWPILFLFSISKLLYFVKFQTGQIVKIVFLLHTTR